MLPIHIPHRSEQSLNLISTSFNSKPSRRQTGNRSCMKYQRVVTARSLKCVQFYDWFRNELHLKKSAIKKTLLIFPLSLAHRNKNRVGGVGKREKTSVVFGRIINPQLHVLKSRGPHSHILMTGGVRRIFLGLTFWPKGIFLGLWKTPGFFWVTKTTEGFLWVLYFSSAQVKNNISATYSFVFYQNRNRLLPKPKLKLACFSFPARR